MHVTTIVSCFSFRAWRRVRETRLSLVGGSKLAVSAGGGVQGGTRRGLRNLLTSLDKVLWDGAPWKSINLGDVSTDGQARPPHSLLICRGSQAILCAIVLFSGRNAAVHARQFAGWSSTALYLHHVEIQCSEVPFGAAFHRG